MSTAELVAVCRVHGLLPDAGTVGVTAIDKRPVDGPVDVGVLGLYADVQADRVHHGGADQAAYAYAAEDADWWEDQIGRPIPPGLFGENLRTRGVDVSEALIGERWRIGSVIFEVTQPRVPCSTFARRMDEDDWVRRFTAANRTGAYLRTVQPGKVASGDAIDIASRPTHGVRISDWFGARAGDATHLAEALAASARAGEFTLSTDMAERVGRAVARWVQQA